MRVGLACFESLYLLPVSTGLECSLLYAFSYKFCAASLQMVLEVDFFHNHYNLFPSLNMIVKLIKGLAYYI